MKYYIIAGERSGDLHASNLIKALKKEDQNAKVRGIGGNYLESAGADLFKKYEEISFMGFLEVFLNLRKISQVMNQCKQDVLTFKPDAVILVDFAGFNLRIASFCKEHNLKVFYYISPKIWAWNQKRAYTIKRLVDRMFVVMPFEKEFYQRFDITVDYVGNPVYDAVTAHKPQNDFLSRLHTPKKLIAILPGSRKQEVERMITLMSDIIPDFPKYEFVIAAVTNLPRSFYQPFEERGIKVVYDETYDLLFHAQAAIVASGTATLETAMFEVPQVVAYRTSPVTYSIAKMLVKVKFISLVNLIAGREVVKELLQSELTLTNLKNELSLILQGPGRERMIEGYKEVKSILGSPGASERTARLMLSYLK